MDVVDKMTDIDPYPVSELQNRYSIGKQAVYNRLDSLGIKPTKQGNRSYISHEQLQALDALDEHLKAGGTMADFQTELPPPETSAISPVGVSTPSTQVDNLVSLVNAIAQALRPADPLAHLERLERAADRGWLLTSNEVKQLIGVKPHVEKEEDSFTRGSFTFVKAGKIGNQTAWQVMKVKGCEVATDND